MVITVVYLDVCFVEGEQGTVRKDAKNFTPVSGVK